MLTPCKQILPPKENGVKAQRLERKLGCNEANIEINEQKWPFGHLNSFIINISLTVFFNLTIIFTFILCPKIL